MNRTLAAFLGLLTFAAGSRAAEIHVAIGGKDDAAGTAAAPLRTIQRAAALAQPGDTVTVHAGTYRESVNPPRGGESDARRIVYRAAPGEKVEIKGSEVVTGWTKVKDDVWTVEVSNSLFGSFNPYGDLIKGDWFNGKGREHHTGAVYLDGEWLDEAAKLEDVLGTAAPDPAKKRTGNVLLNVAWIRAGQQADRVPAAGFAAAQEGVKKAPCEEGGECIGWIEDGDWVRYNGVPFGDRAEKVELRVASATAGGRIELRAGAPDGELLGTAAVPHTGGWQKWVSVNAAIKASSGARTLCLVFRAPASAPSNAALWFARVEGDKTKIWAQFKGVNPNERLVEINVRRTVFYPDKPGRNYITVRGFALRHAATPWAPPTAEQPGLIGTHWSRGWVIESNIVSHSKCVGVALGKHGDRLDNTSANSAEGYVKTIERALAHPIPWTRENIGHHVVRDNVISHCEQAGVVGSLGAAFSRITGNTIHDIHVRRLFTGAEMAGIKIHASIDCEIRGNRIFRTCRGLWMDWMAQGTRITQNLCYENASEDLFMEVDHGPYLIDNNIFLSPVNLLDMSQGGAFAHNLWAGKIVSTEEPGRETPYHPAHATSMAGLRTIQGGDNRFYNNIFIGAGADPSAAAPAKGDRHRRVAGYGTWVYDTREHPTFAGGNVYLNGARPYAKEDKPVVASANPGVKLVEDGGAGFVAFEAGTELGRAATTLVTTKLLGKALIPQVSYENPDGSPLAVDMDFAGKKRDGEKPTPGPFEKPGEGGLKIKVW